MKKKFLIVLFFCASLIVKSQWLALPNAIGPYTGPNACFISLTVPQTILPVGNGKILYTTDCQKTPSSGGEVFVQISTNDMSSMQIKLYNSGLGCCPLGNIYPYNDSTYSYITSYTGISEVKLIQNNFSLITSLNTYPLPAGKATSISPNNVYSIFQYTPNDSMKVFKSNKTGSSISQKSNFLFNVISDKLQFINDSTGFTLAVYKSNTAKTVLLKTVDFGATWLPSFTDSTDAIRDYHVLPSGKAYLCKQSGAILYSTNEGSSWVAQNPAPAGNYFSIRFQNDSTGYIGGSSGNLFKTINYGTSWTNEISNAALQIDRIFTFGNVAYFVDSSKKVFKNKLLIYQVFKSLSNSYSSTISCVPSPVTETFTISSNGGGPYNIVVQTPTCATSYTTANTTGNTTFTFNCPGVYTLTAYDGLSTMIGVKNYSVYQGNVYYLPITATKDTVCPSETDTLTFITSTANYTITSFMWNNTSTSMPLIVTPAITTNYNLFIGQLTTGTKTCNVSASKTIVVIPCVGINEIGNSKSFKIYPNPAYNTLFISTNEREFQKSEIEIYNSLEQLVLKRPFINEIDIKSLVNGCYVIKMIMADKNSYHKKFIKESE